MKKKITLILVGFFVSCLTIQAQTWTQVGVDIDGEASGDNSGWSVSLSADGSTLAIGANGNDESGTNAGQVRIYQNNTGTWTQIGSDIDGETADDRSGYSVDLSDDGSIVAIGATYNDGTGTDAGHTRIYRNNAGTWTQIGADINGEAANDFFGWSVSLSADGSIVAIGAYGNDGVGSIAGHVRIYRNIADTWTQIGADIDAEAAFDYSGMSVSISADGSTVAIGADRNDGAGSQSGHVRIFRNNAGTWTQIGTDIDGEAANDNSGRSISLSADGLTLAIGAYGNDGTGSDAGHVRIFRNIADTWTQVGADINGEAADDLSGFSVSLSDDGSTIAIGAFSNDGAGTNAGQVRIYQNIAETWTQIDSDIDGEGSNDNSGWSVSLSGDGSTVAIGAPYNDGTGSDAGHVRVYDFKLDQTITFNALTSKTYGDANFTVSATGGTSGNPVVFSSSDDNIATCSGTNGEIITIINSGSCSIYANQAGNEVYRAALQKEQILTINTYPITITSDAGQTKVYGEINPLYTYTATTLLNSDEYTGELSRELGEDAGNYTINQNDLTAGTNYVITFVSNDFEITAMPVTVTADAGQTKVYGETDPLFTYTATTLLNSDEYSGALSREAGEDAGTYAILQNNLTAGTNYEITFVSDDFEISAMPVTVTADAGQTKIYGETDPLFTYTATTLLNSDEYSGALSREAGEDAGTYAIIQNNLTAGTNYVITFVSNDFEISAMPVTVTVDAGQTKVFGETDPTVYLYTATTLLNTDEYIGALSREAGEDAGTYTILQNNITAGTNYEITFVSDDFEISAMPVTVSADAGQTKIYGETDPTLFTYTATTLLNSDEYTGVLSREVGEDAGTYAILQNNLTAGTNYEITFVSDDFEITKATPIITWDNPADIYYGTALSETQLNAIANTGGNFIYSPISGMTLEIGNNQELTTNFTPTDATNYNIANAVVYINVLENVNISNLSLTNILLYPNPTNGIINFDFADNAIKKLSISDITGKVIIEKLNVQQNETIDLSNIENGIYIISIQTDKIMFTTKIIKR